MEIKLPVKTNPNKDATDSSNVFKQSEQKMRLQSGKARQKVVSDRQRTGSESPVSVRLGRTMSKMSQQPLSHMQQIGATQQQINNLIDELDFKLQANYHSKEHSLIESYREQLIKAHRELTELRSKYNEQQIKNEMNEKFLQLKKQRLELIQVNMFYSNKCQEYKQLLDAKLSEGHELEREIRFLEKQINNSNAKQVELMSQLYERTSPLKFYNSPQDYPQLSQNIISMENIKIQSDTKRQTTHKHQESHTATPNKKGSLSTHANTEIMPKIGLNSLSKGKIKLDSSRIPEFNNQVQKIFDQKLGHAENLTDRSSAKNTTILSKLATLQNSTSLPNTKSAPKQPSQIEALFLKTVNEVRDKKGPKKQITLFKGEEFTDLEKKQIMKAFLSKQQVKQYIYNIIFDKTEDERLFRKKSFKDKFKIVASEQKPNSPNQLTE